MISFRAIQGLSIGTAFLYWAVRFASHPGHLHPVLLGATVMVAIVSELSYRAGKKEAAERIAKLRKITGR